MKLRIDFIVYFFTGKYLCSIDQLRGHNKFMHKIIDLVAKTAIIKWFCFILFYTYILHNSVEIL